MRPAPSPSGEASAADGAYELPDGAKLAYLTFGDPSGSVAVVVPGLTDGLAPVFDPDGAEAIDEPPRAFRRHRVFVVSHRDPLLAGVSTATMAEDLARFLSDVSGPAVLVGHSMGGMVVQHLAARHPELAERIVMSSTVPSADEAFRGVLDRWDDLLQEGRWRAFYREAIDASFAGVGRLWRRVALRLSSAEGRPDALVTRHLRLSEACRNHDARDLLGEIRVPTLVLAGSEDRVTRPERAREIASSIPGSRLVIIERAGHGLPDQRRRAYARATAAFLPEATSR